METTKCHTIDEFKLLGILEWALGISRLFEQCEYHKAFSQHPLWEKKAKFLDSMSCVCQSSFSILTRGNPGDRGSCIILVTLTTKWKMVTDLWSWNYLYFPTSPFPSPLSPPTTFPPPPPPDLGESKDRPCENIKCISPLCSEKIIASAKDLFFLFATLKKGKKPTRAKATGLFGFGVYFFAMQ